jgi:hypothetical protein
VAAGADGRYGRCGYGGHVELKGYRELETAGR